MFDSRRRFLRACAGACVLLPATGHAGDAWTQIDPSQWTPADTQTILERSPWVKGVNPELSPDWLRSLEKNTKLVPSAEGIRDKRILSELTVIVRWESGLPVRLARHSGTEPAYVPDHFVLSVSRVPTSFMAAMAGDSQSKDKALLAQQMLKSSSLTLGAKPPIPAEDAEWALSDFESRLMLSFPQGRQTVESSDGVATFACQMGFLLLRASFPLRRMIYRGKLAL